MRDEFKSIATMMLGQQKKTRSEVVAFMRTIAPDAVDELEEWLDRRARDNFLTSVHPEWRGQVVRDLGEEEAHYPGPHEGMDVAWRVAREAIRERIGSAALRRVDSQSTDIVSSLGDPHQPLANRRGLVVGHVQSGKTANYTATIAKAADWGYSLVIVLAGLHTALRQQTQRRLDEDLVKSLRRHRREGDWLWYWLTQAEEDFAPPKGSADGLLLSVGVRSIAVVKKNKSRLQSLVDWLGDVDEAIRQKAAVLVIDDESDQASINTASGERTAINRLIVDLLQTMPTASYVGYTATPYANVLIDPKDDDDLYPRHFIIGLPQPDGYQGSEILFGRNELRDDLPVDGYDVVRTVPEDDVERVAPPNNKEEREGFHPEVADSLAEALRWFLLATAARRARGQVSHSTCLVHASRYVDQHFRLERVIKQWLAQVRPEDSAFEATWSRESTVNSPPTSADELRWTDVSRHLAPVIDDVRVAVDNGVADPEQRLRYGATPETVVAVGGDTLSRGLTLEGLVSSYFVRSSGTYDALMQMGRWFGFRPGYEDLPRVWTDGETMKAFRHLSTVEQEIRADIDAYRGPRTPMDLAVRIRTHPSLRVTSPQKMRYAMRAAINYAGSRMQTTFFDVHDADWLNQNLQAADNLVRALEGSREIKGLRAGVNGWADADSAIVERFLLEYQFHREHEELDTDLLLQWLNRRRDHEDPVAWNVVVLGRTEDHMTVGDERVDLGTVTLGSRTWNAISRARKRGTWQPADIGALMSPPDRVIDLPEVDGNRPTRELSEDRSTVAPGTALLALYPISRHSVPLKVSTATRESLDARDHVLGVGLVLPPPTRGVIDDVTTVEYVSVPLEGKDDLTDEYERRLLSGELDDEGDADTHIPEDL